MPRCGPPHSFGWLKIETHEHIEVWEDPAGGCWTVPANCWIERSPAGAIRIVDAPTTYVNKFRHA